MEQWRCFVAVPIGETLRAELAQAVDRWRRRPDLDGLRWTDPAGWHVTLAFLGATEPSRVPAIMSALQACALGRHALRLATGGVGGFPTLARARVAWYGADDAAGELASLAAGVRDALGLDVKDPHRAHVTLARARRDAIDLRSWAAQASAPVGEVGVDHLDLMRSHLGAGPARYEALGSVPLGVAARV